MGMLIVKVKRAVLGVSMGHSIVTNGILCVRGGDALFPNDFEKNLLAICRPSGCTMASGIVGVVVIIVVVVGVCNRSQMRTSKCTCSIFGVSIGLGS